MTISMLILGLLPLVLLPGLLRSDDDDDGPIPDLMEDTADPGTGTALAIATGDLDPGPGDFEGTLADGLAGGAASGSPGAIQKVDPVPSPDPVSAADPMALPQDRPSAPEATLPIPEAIEAVPDGAQAGSGADTEGFEGAQSDDNVLAPVDPDLPDEPSEAGPLPWDAVPPTAPEIADSPGPETDTDAPLRPILDDEEAAAPYDVAISAAFGREAASASGDQDGHTDDSEVFWWQGDRPPEIDGFIPGEDALRITLNPRAGYKAPVVEIETDGSDAILKVDGRPVATLRGGAGVRLADIHVEVESATFDYDRAA